MSNYLGKLYICETNEMIIHLESQREITPVLQKWLILIGATYKLHSQWYFILLKLHSKHFTSDQLEQIKGQSSIITVISLIFCHLDLYTAPT